MTQTGPSCTPSYRLGKEVMSFIQLPYKKQQEILGRSTEVCNYYRGFNDRLLAALKPNETLSDVKGPTGTSSMAQFSTVAEPGINSAPTVYSFDYDPKTTFTHSLRVQAPDDPHDIVYDFEKSGPVEVLTRVHYTAASGEARDVSPQQLKSESASAPEAKRALALYRDYQYYRPTVSLCVYRHAEANCVDAWKKTRATSP